MTIVVGDAIDDSMPFWRRVGWITAGQTMEKAAQLLVVVLLVRVIAPAEWNVVALALTAYYAGITIGSFNIEQSILFYLPRHDLSVQAGLIRRTVGMLAISGASVGAVIGAAGMSGVAPGSSVIWLWVGVAVAAEMPTVIAGPVLLLRSRVSAAGAWDSAQALVQVVSIVVFAVSGSGAVRPVLGLVVASVLRLVSFLVVFRNFFGTGISGADRRFTIDQIRFCLPLGVALATGTLARTADKWILAWKAPHQIGLFVVAAQEVPLLAVLPYAGGAAIAVLMVRQLAAGKSDEAHGLWYRQAASMCRTVVPLTMGTALIAPEVFRLLFGTRYGGSVLPFQVFALIGLHRVSEYGVILRSAGRTRDVATSSVVLLGSIIALGIPGVLMGGMAGLTASTVCAHLVAWWWVLGKVASIFGRTRQTVFPWTDWASRVLLYGAATFAVGWMASFVDGTTQRLLTKSLAMGAVVVFTEFGATRFRESLSATQLEGCHVR